MIGMKQGVSDRRHGGRWLAGVIVLLGAGSLEASPLVRRNWAGADRTTIREWSHYLLGGPSVWARVNHPPVTQAIESSIRRSLRTHVGEADPMIQFLVWRMDIAPRRFTHYHPRLAPVLKRLTKTPSAPHQFVPQPPAPPSSTSQGGHASPPSVPEPDSVLLALGLTAWAAWRGCRHRARAVTSPAGRAGSLVAAAPLLVD